MAKPNTQIIIDAIVKEIEKGNDRAKILATIGNNWQISVRTFDRYLKTAQEQLKERQTKGKEAADRVYIKAHEDSAIEAVMSAQERKEVLTRIARGEIMLVKHIVADSIIEEREILPDWMDRKNAIAELNKMDGSYAVQKIETALTFNVEIKED